MCRPVPCQLRSFGRKLRPSPAPECTVRLVSSVPDRRNGASARRARRCPHGLAGLLAAGALLWFSAPVAAQSDMERQAQCELSAIRDTRSPLAVQYIRSACNWLAVNGDSLLNASSKGYYVCLVRQLSGAQSNEAAAAIMSACRASNPL
ncbi:VF_A0006 family four-cysteine protein [Bradyrhizobium stylosanthis]|uniref:VF_A0006 family four-cysteine protein n=1 Tax=Bradyrhizobium stylosanthis TaxID=1803665 RepID=UPI0024C0C346|nr:VF_A0006 family four-cysteine protein [Bradyrhizobium stylosanthis]